MVRGLLAGGGCPIQPSKQINQPNRSQKANKKTNRPPNNPLKQNPCPNRRAGALFLPPFNFGQVAKRAFQAVIRQALCQGLVRGRQPPRCCWVKTDWEVRVCVEKTRFWANRPINWWENTMHAWDFGVHTVAPDHSAHSEGEFFVSHLFLFFLHPFQMYPCATQRTLRSVAPSRLPPFSPEKKEPGPLQTVRQGLHPTLPPKERLDGGQGNKKNTEARLDEFLEGGESWVIDGA